MVDPLKILWVLTNSTYLVSKFLRNSESSEDAPYFEHSLYQAEVKESEEVHHHVITVTAENHDEDLDFRYEIAGGNVGDVFRIDPDTGVISVAAPLDYESRKQYSLELSVTDGEFTSYATLVVKVTDVNDNPPVFERPSYRTQITEEDDRNLPRRILQVNVTDADKDRARDVVYFLTGPGVDTDEPSSAQFSINSTTGEIYVLKPLDRDLPAGRAQWRFTVFAQDEGGQGLVGYADILVNLKDINDNPPVFPEPLTFANVTENGTAGLVVVSMAALDYDDPEEGGNAQLTYNIERNALDELTGAAMFIVDRQTGEVRTAVCCLDREKTPDYTLQIVAQDGGGMKGTGTVSILVSDINDMPPVFTKEEWVTEVNETDQISDVAILTVTVIDRDETNNFHYKVVEGSGFGTDKFSMVRNPDGTGSLRVSRPLDYEDPKQRPGFRFKIQVNDQGPNTTEDAGHVAYSWVVVRLKDVNDNPPHLDKTRAKVTLKEDIKVGTLVETFTARDPDQGGEGRVLFALKQLSDPKRHFRITQEGRVLVQRELDRETVPVHKLLITVADQGHPPLTATATLTVTLQDVNDNPPSLLSQYQPVLTENSPPRVLIHLYATDADEHGPPFNFSLDSNQHLELSKLFRVETDPKGDNGRGVGIVSSLASFDREHQKLYLLPILVSDSGKPRLTGTSTLSVVIGDVNDNPMSAGATEITVYKLEGSEEPMDIGRVYAADLDDWDLPDKTFSWNSSPSPHFQLHTDSGQLTMSADTPRGSYTLHVTARDARREERAECDVTVNVKLLTRLALRNSQVATFSGVTDSELIKKLNDSPSLVERFVRCLAEMLNTTEDKVEVFSVQNRRSDHLLTDVRFVVKDSFQYFKPVRLSGLLLMYRDKIEESVGLQLTSVGSDKCLNEAEGCEESCSVHHTLSPSGIQIVANTSGLAGPLLIEEVDCVCKARDFRRPETCQTSPCLNHGTCVETQHGPTCACLHGYEGPRCQGTSRGFQGSGFAWFPGLEACSHSHLSLEFLTENAEGTLVYNGPLAPPNPHREIIPDFISVELFEGKVQVLADFGSGTVNLTTSPRVNDGSWHRLDILWGDEEIRLVLDLCKIQPTDSTDHDWSAHDGAGCYASSPLPLFNTQLNLDSPLQLGGVLSQGLDYRQYGWLLTPKFKSFNGCIKNVVLNGQLLDLASPSHSRDSLSGCVHTELHCSASCSLHSSCEVSLSSPVARCRCHPGYSGLSCSAPTTPSTFLPGSFVKYSLAFQPDLFHNTLQLRFRTREPRGELFRLVNQHHSEYLILEIVEGTIQARMMLDSLNLQSKETVVSLHFVRVTDGRWHFVKVSRHGSALVLQLDGGEGRRYNESFQFQGHQLLSVDKQEGVFAGGPADYIGIKDLFAVESFQNGCMDDIRLDGRHLPLPPGTNGSQWGQVPISRSLESQCQSKSVCREVQCPDTFVCQDIWNDYVCTCGPGQLATADGKGCTARSDCLSAPCQHGGRCMDSSETAGHNYRCVCPDTYTGQHCELSQERQTLKLGVTAFCTIVGCILLILLIVFLLVIYTRKRETHIKKPHCEDVRENIIRYQDEGGGEEDMNPVDLLPLKVPRQQQKIKLKVPELIEETSLEHTLDLQDFWKRLDSHRDESLDSTINFAFEGNCQSPTGSLSSLELDKEDDERVRCVVLGPRFHSLVEIYSAVPGASLEDSV